MRVLSIITGFILSATTTTYADEEVPSWPTPAQIAKLIGLDKSRVSTDGKEQNSEWEDKVIWVVTYEISGDQDCGITLSLFQKDRIKTNLTGRWGVSENEFQKITRDDGDVIYRSQADMGTVGAVYMTTLINHESDWDVRLSLWRNGNVGESKLAFAITKDAVELIGEVETLLRTPKAEQADDTN